MKRILSLFGVAAMAASCQTAHTSTTPEVEGEVIDATMNTVTIATRAHDTLSFSTMALRDSSRMIGVFIGDTIGVNYRELKSEHGESYLEATVVDLVYRPAQYYLEGEWVEPIPGQSDNVQGFVLNSDGTARSVNMATLQVDGWGYSAGDLRLRVTSIGNGVTSTSDDVYKVLKADTDSLVLSREGSVVWRLSRRR